MHEAPGSARHFEGGADALQFVHVKAARAVTVAIPGSETELTVTRSAEWLKLRRACCAEHGVETAATGAAWR